MIYSNQTDQTDPTEQDDSKAKVSAYWETRFEPFLLSHHKKHIPQLSSEITLKVGKWLFAYWLHHRMEKDEAMLRVIKLHVKHSEEGKKMDLSKYENCSTRAEAKLISILAKKFPFDIERGFESEEVKQSERDRWDYFSGLYYRLLITPDKGIEEFTRGVFKSTPIPSREERNIAQNIWKSLHLIAKTEVLPEGEWYYLIHTLSDSAQAKGYDILSKLLYALGVKGYNLMLIEEKSTVWNVTGYQDPTTLVIGRGRPVSLDHLLAYYCIRAIHGEILTYNLRIRRNRVSSKPITRIKVFFVDLLSEFGIEVRGYSDFTKTSADKAYEAYYNRLLLLDPDIYTNRPPKPRNMDLMDFAPTERD